MKKKNLLMTAIAIFGLATITNAQVPSYVPTNGLVGWWPFNGNANDESGNGNNGAVNGAALTSDRNGQTSSAYNFNVNNWSFGSGGDNIYIPYNSSFNFSDFTISTWVKRTSAGSTISPQSLSIIRRYQYGYNNPNGETWVLEVAHGTSPSGSILYGTVIEQSPSPAQNFYTQSNQTVPLNQWCNIIMTYSQSTINLYINNQLVGTATDPSITINTIGNSGISIGLSEQANGQWAPFDGSIDDIGIWNRALTQQEITALYNSQTCNSTSNTITADGLTTFCAGNSVNLTSDVVGGTYQWKRNGVNIATNSTSRTFKASSTGSYTCVAICNGTALPSNAIAVTSKTNAAATVTASGATSFCAGDSVTLNCSNLGSNYSVQWYRSNISIENATAYTRVVKQPGTYKVVTKNLTTGCSRISGSAITAIVNCRIANSTDNNFNATSDNLLTEKITGNDISDGVSIYPNPSNGTFVLEYEGEQSGSGFMQVVNSMGQTIYESNVEVADGLFSKEVKLGDNISKGIYVVRLLINGSVNDSRIIVK